MAVCQDSQMSWAAEKFLGMRHHTTPSGEDRMMIDKPQVLAGNTMHGNGSVVQISDSITGRDNLNKPQRRSNISQVRMRSVIYSRSISEPDATTGALDVGMVNGQSTSPRPHLGAFDSSTGLPWQSVPFAPEIDNQAVKLSDKVSNRSPPTLPMPSWSGCGLSESFPAAKTSPTPSDLLLPLQDLDVEAERLQLEAQVNKFLASVDRDLFGREPRAPPREEDLVAPLYEEESGEIIEDQPHGNAVLKRGREEESPKPVKRARRNPRREYSMMSSVSRSGKQYYSGPYLNSTSLHQQTSYIPIKRLGTGGQGTAHLLKTPRRGSLVVCKVIPHHRSHKYVESELAFLRDILRPHPRIVRIRSALVSPIQTQLYLDYYNGGDLTSFMEKYHYGLHSHPIPESFIWHTLLQLSEALAYIHHGYDRTTSSITGRQKLPDNWLTVIHRDIKPANILLQRAPHSTDHPGPEPYPRLVLADFGLALQALDTNVLPTSDSAVGTFAWQPPESPHHSTKGDVWSLGAVVFEMCTGRLPFDEEMPEWVNDIHTFRAWCGTLSEREKRGLFEIAGA
ncbi:MAG: hypothetical protein Q9216_007150, partial [Gyalolechia sp. 2 TL-2023]